MEKLKIFLRLIDKPVFVLICVLVIIEIYSECNQLMTHPKYTVGITTEFYYSGHGIKNIRYTYQVNGKVYEKGKRHRGAQLGKRYFVKFSSLTPRYNELFQDSPVPDTLQFIPPEGWDKIPVKQNVD